MNSENTPKEIVKAFIDLTNMAKRLMDKTQKPCVQQETIQQYKRWREER